MFVGKCFDAFLMTFQLRLSSTMAFVWINSINGEPPPVIMCGVWSVEHFVGCVGERIRQTNLVKVNAKKEGQQHRKNDDCFSKPILHYCEAIDSDSFLSISDSLLLTSIRVILY